MNYEQRVVAFLDILGFKSLLDETVDKDGNDIEEKIDYIVSAYKVIREVWNLDNIDVLTQLQDPGSKKVSIFSDSIVVSFNVEDPSEVFSTLLEIKHVIMELISRKILCRGAVAMGKFIHTDNYLFGPALVEAYTLESKAAMYPRVILDNSVIDAGVRYRSNRHSSITESKYVKSLLEQDSDGMYYIDYYFKAQSELNDPHYDFPVYIENLGNIIRAGLMGSSHHSKADLRVKYSWMRERYNRMVDIVSSSEFIDNLQSYNETELSEFYMNLKKISPNKYTLKFKD